MDEVKFQKLCTPTIHYRSLREQEEARIYPIRQAIPHTLSTSRPTYVHLIVHLEDHWAAVQISLCPFTLHDIHGQTFYRCHYRYTLCCSSKDKEDDSTCSLVKNAVQSICDAYYRPVWWNFSNKQSYTKETPGSGDGEANFTCTEATELRLLNYIKSATKAFDDGIILFRTPAAEVTTSSGSKRPHGLSEHANIMEANIYERGKRRKPAISSSPRQETVDIDSVAEEEVDEEAEEETPCQKISRTVVKKILSGIKDPKWAHAVNTQVQVIDGSSVEQYKDPSLYFESQLWLQSSKLIVTAPRTAWKYRFLASCFRLVLAGQTVPSEQEMEIIGTNSLTIRRWKIAAYMINMIVNGLAEAWGEKADLVYEALAVKNFVLNECTKLSEGRRKEVIDLVVKILSQKDVPATDFQCPRFHPAFCISIMLNRDYAEICDALRLGYYARGGLPIAKENLFCLPWEPRMQLAIRGTVADPVLQETQLTDSGRLNADLGDSRQEGSTILTRPVPELSLGDPCGVQSVLPESDEALEAEPHDARISQGSVPDDQNQPAILQDHIQGFEQLTNRIVSSGLDGFQRESNIPLLSTKEQPAQLGTEPDPTSINPLQYDALTDPYPSLQSYNPYLSLTSEYPYNSLFNTTLLDIGNYLPVEGHSL